VSNDWLLGMLETSSGLRFRVAGIDVASSKTKPSVDAEGFTFCEAAFLNDCPASGDQVKEQSDHGEYQQNVDQ
jgi:hypothetical protein